MSGHRRARRRAWKSRADKIRSERTLRWAFRTSLFSCSLTRRDWRRVRQANRVGKAAIFHKKGATIMFMPPQEKHWLASDSGEAR